MELNCTDSWRAYGVVQCETEVCNYLCRNVQDQTSVYCWILTSATSTLDACWCVTKWTDGKTTKVVVKITESSEKTSIQYKGLLLEAFGMSYYWDSSGGRTIKYLDGSGRTPEESKCGLHDRKVFTIKSLNVKQSLDQLIAQAWDSVDWCSVWLHILGPKDTLYEYDISEPTITAVDTKEADVDKSDRNDTICLREISEIHSRLDPTNGVCLHGKNIVNQRLWMKIQRLAYCARARSKLTMQSRSKSRRVTKVPVLLKSWWRSFQLVASWWSGTTVYSLIAFQMEIVFGTLHNVFGTLPRTLGPPGGRHMYYIMCQHHYRPHMQNSIFTTVRQFWTGVRDSNQAGYQQKSQLSTLARSLQFMAMDNVVALSKTIYGSQFVIKIICRCSKLTWAVGTAKMTITQIVKIFLDHWVMKYGIPMYMLIVKGMHFIQKLVSTLCIFLRHM